MYRALQFSLLFVLVAIAMLAGSNEAAARSKRSIVCTMEYRPVCALGRDGIRRTYSNACVARASGARILHAGECYGPFFCFLIYAPVCARDVRGIPRTYPNLCAAENDNAVFLRKGPCN